jgi:malate/lactate dehydrogenase
VLAALDGEFGVRGRVAAVPAQLGPSGVVRILVPKLNTRERVQVETALQI